ncbi:uncharacterized protein LOC135841305 isoform X2 [Planococcus citri]|uniref:uncharacterized protein LOC135841305 isoform X2 n=1 Tax=Planococcus citri TaxID=170843 RepID=UPI0031F833AA
MNNKNNDQEPIAEKIQNNYPQLTLHSLTKSAEVSSNDCGSKPSSVISTKAPVPVTTAATVNKSPIPSIKKSISPGNDRKVPPYVNALPQDPVRVAKAPVQRPFVKAVPKVTTEKITVTAESTVTSIQTPNKPSASGDVKRTQYSPPVRANVVLTTTKQTDKAIVSSTTTSPEESKPSSSSESEPKSADKATPAQPNRSVQLQCRTTDGFQKNIESNVLTVTRNPMPKSPATIKMMPAKDTKTMESNVVVNTPPKPSTPTVAPSTPKTTPPKQTIVSTSLCKNFPKAVSIQNIDSPKPVARFSSPNIISKTETINSMPPTTDANLKPVTKLVIVTSADTSVKTTSPSVSVSSSSKIQTYESSAVTSSPSTKGSKSNQSSSNLKLLSLSDLESNQDILNAINSGSTACVGENVTISSAPGEVVLICQNARSSVDPKIRNVSSETTIETITMQVNNPGSPAQKNKNGVSTESVCQSFKQDSTPNSSASSPGEARTPKRDEIPGLADEGKGSSSSMTLNKKIDEPECLTISSDEETEPEQFVSSDNSDISISLLSKEPPIGCDNEVFNEQFDDGAREKEEDTMLEATTGDGFTNLVCRTVRIGSYKVKPRTGVTVSKYGLKIVVPPLNNSNDSVAVKIPIHDITKVLVHYNRTLPVIFYYITPRAGAKIRQVLKMNDSSNSYINPNSIDYSQRRITLLPEKFTEDDKEDIQNYYLNRDVLEELSYVDANKLLVQSVPKDIQKTVRLPPKPVQTIMVYPPPPTKGGISINTEDYSCLAEDTYLNDVIIDFYLKYLYQEKLTEEDKQKTHIFSSFFYKRLTDKATPVPRMLQNSKPNDVTISAAEIRHDRVKKWTKNIDIFSKDYIVIPLNENQHWFLAIICFPGLAGPVRFSDNSPIDVDSSNKTDDEKVENSNATEAEADSSQTRRIGSTTITPIGRNSYTLNDDDGEMEDRDEASGADEDVDEFLSSEEDTDDPYSDPELAELGDNEATPKKKPDREPIKQPCILIFDSLKSASRARIIATLREYLHVEYKTKHNGEERDFSKNVVKGACPRVPQQTNYTDCGLYVLQYVETFFDKKITDFHIPIKTLGRWFHAETVSIKRYHIQQLLLKLMEEQKINVHALHLPELNLSPRYHYESDSDDDDMDDYEGYYDEEGDEYGHLVSYDEEEEEEDEIGDHENRMRRFMVTEDEYIEEDEEDGESRYALFDADEQEESDSHEELSDDDDAYKDLDELDRGERMPSSRQRRTLISVTRGGDGPDDEEILHEEEEEYDEDLDGDDEELRINLNKENVTISRMPAGSGVGVGAGAGVAAVKSQSQGSETTSASTLEELKCARPWSKKLNEVRIEPITVEESARPSKKLNEVSIERATEEDCPNKKFKSN